MTHEKLVAGTESPTRYTKIIRFPGAGTKYNRTYQETDYVSRYTKTVAGGKDYVPPAPPFDPLAVADGQGSNWVGSNVYEVGQTVEGRTAAYTGGLEPVTYRYRFQFKATGSDTWINEPWVNTTNAKNSVTFTLTETGQIKLQSQARDAQDPVVQLNSVTGIKTVTEAPSTEIGNLIRAVDGNDYDDEPIETFDSTTHTLAVDHDGDASPTFNWSVARGTATLSPFGNGSCTALIATPAPGSCQIQCDIIDNTATDSPKSFRYLFVIIE
jgi:hypothetical protein